MPVHPVPASAGETKHKLAFGLGGLGGANAHGAGFLAAANDLGIRPGMISCTSGMIEWVARYLRGDNLFTVMEEVVHKEEDLPPPFDAYNTLTAMMFGLPGVFRPAILEYWERWFTPVGHLTLKELFNRLLPAQQWVPTRPERDFEDIARTLAEADIPVMFNSFQPKAGIEYLHINEAGAKALNVRYGERDNVTVYEPITTEGVEAALWLYLYGFKDRFNNKHLIDGAYHRQFILRELDGADRIYVPRPINFRWIGALPTNLLGSRDFEINMWFNASYAGEVGKMVLVNELLASGDLDPGKFNHTDVIPINIDHQLGFLDFFYEKMSVFQDSYAKSLDVLTAWERADDRTVYPSTAPEAAPHLHHHPQPVKG